MSDLLARFVADWEPGTRRPRLYFSRYWAYHLLTSREPHRVLACWWKWARTYRLGWRIEKRLGYLEEPPA